MTVQQLARDPAAIRAYQHVRQRGCDDIVVIFFETDSSLDDTFVGLPRVEALAHLRAMLSSYPDIEIGKMIEMLSRGAPRAALTNTVKLTDEAFWLAALSYKDEHLVFEVVLVGVSHGRRPEA